ncbi:MAG: XdhC family protein [Fidelibacterota bacterium]
MDNGKDIFQIAADLKSAGEEFALATVVAVKGSTSGKVGNRVIYDREGNRISGWIGAGCVEERIGKMAKDTFRSGRPRVVTIDLDSDTLTSGIPCGGAMSILVEPQLKRPVMIIRGTGRVVETLLTLGELLGFRVETRDDVLSEETGRMDYLVLATHHRDDHKVTCEALKMGVPFVAVVASSKRTALIRDYLVKAGMTGEQLRRFHAPAGLDLKGDSPEEIALSIMAEIVMHRRGGTGRPLMTVTRHEQEP